MKVKFEYEPDQSNVKGLWTFHEKNNTLTLKYII